MRLPCIKYETMPEVDRGMADRYTSNIFAPELCNTLGHIFLHLVEDSSLHFVHSNIRISVLFEPRCSAEHRRRSH